MLSFDDNSFLLQYGFNCVCVESYDHGISGKPAILEGAFRIFTHKKILLTLPYIIAIQ